jgi:hypothetical protein
VAEARLPGFYRDYAVPDTVNGRFDLIVLHLALVLDRLAEEPALRTLGQGLFDRFWRDTDHNLREMGVDDLAVPRQMRGMGEAFYGRAQVYRRRWPQATTKPWPRRSSGISMAERRTRPGTALRPICGRRYVSYRRWTRG